MTVSPFLKRPLRSEAEVRALRIEKVCRELLRDIPATIRDAIAGDLNDREILLLFAQMRFERECNL